MPVPGVLCGDCSCRLQTAEIIYHARMLKIPKYHIASTYLPDRYLQGYSFCKLATDPLYQAVCAEFHEHQEPLLDLGCGIGLLAQCLRALANPIEYIGVDSDADKIAIARAASVKRELHGARYEVCDLSVALPAHSGSIALLDVLQYLVPETRQRVLQQIASRLSANGKAVLRIGVEDQSWRAAFARGADRFGHKVRWMRSSFKSLPTRAELSKGLLDVGLDAHFRPLWGRTPFNNYLVIATKR
jgi:SAM-dependent methyltransferase